MLPEKFCYWLKGFSELSGEKPSAIQWIKIKEELAKAKEISLDMHASYASITMSPEHFCVWLSGFCELFNEIPDQKQWNSIKEHLDLVFTKITSKGPGDLIKELDKIQRHDIFTSPLIPFDPSEIPQWPSKLSPETGPILIC